MTGVVKMRLVPYESKGAERKRYDHPTPPVDPIVKQLQELDDAMKTIMYNKTTPLNDKLALYNQTLRRYKTYHKQYQKKMVKPIPPQLTHAQVQTVQNASPQTIEPQSVTPNQSRRSRPLKRLTKERSTSPASKVFNETEPPKRPVTRSQRHKSRSKSKPRSRSLESSWQNWTKATRKKRKQ